jgi:isopentenyl diphosphate isomerase/L-lactate dehydrogenase-like FMN-dependent dehydrogenase
MSHLSNCYNVSDFREAARRRLPKFIFEFIDRGAEDEVALAENIEAFRRIKLLTNFCTDLSERDMGTELFGKRLNLPLIIAPTGAAGLCWYKGELELAKAAARAGIPFAISWAALTSMETIAKEAAGRLWYQLYYWTEENLTFETIARACDLGYEALVVTIDTALGRSREYNDRNGFTDPITFNRKIVADLALRPRWCLDVIGRYLATTGMPKHENFPDKYRSSRTKPINDPGLNWKHIEKIREFWPRTLILKGILSRSDAIRAVECGADGISVSNHGGRALDSAVSPIEILPDIADAVGSRTTILLDGGVRRGTDIIKALALGAKAVMIGRATLFATAVAGQDGATKMIDILSTEFEKNMAYVGCRNVKEIGPHILSPRTARELAFGDKPRLHSSE